MTPLRFPWRPTRRQRIPARTPMHGVKRQQLQKSNLGWLHLDRLDHFHVKLDNQEATRRGLSITCRKVGYDREEPPHPCTRQIEGIHLTHQSFGVGAEMKQRPEEAPLRRGVQGTRPWASHALPRDNLVGEAMTRDRKHEGPSATLRSPPRTLMGTHRGGPLQTHLQSSEVRWLHLEGLLYANGLKLQGHRRGLMTRRRQLKHP
jgi:hypothetical protein